MASSDIPARLTAQGFYMNNEKIALLAYSIDGYNYVKLRDAAKIFGVNVEYDEATDTVYLGEIPQHMQESKPETPSENYIDGNAYAREDFSQSANPNIFNEVYTKEAYNALRQSIVDIDAITAGTDENGYNPSYRYAHFVDKTGTSNYGGDTIKAMTSVCAYISGYYSFGLGKEPGFKNLYEYPGYRICNVQVHKFFEPANRATDEFIKSLDGLSDWDKVKTMETYIGDRVVYKDEDTGAINEMFTSSEPVNGICGTYANAFEYLCQRAKIPCVAVVSDMHAWNEVYVDGVWRTTDVSYYDVSRTDEMLLRDEFNCTDINPARTNFAKELLVPMSTK